MFIIIWEYKVKRSEVSRFLSVYGPNGRWAEFFRKGAGYQETALLECVTEELKYVTIDYWDTEQDFRRFRHEYSDEYAAIDRECEDLTESETKIGEYTSL